MPYLIERPDAELISNDDIPGLEDMPYLAILYFPTGGSSITAGHRAVLSKLVELATGAGDDYFYDIEAMASRLGSAAANKALSQRRLGSSIFALVDAGGMPEKVNRTDATGESRAEDSGVVDGDNAQVWRSCWISVFTTNPRSYTAKLRTQKRGRAYNAA